MSVGVSAHLTMTDAGHHSLHFTSVLKVFDDGTPKIIQPHVNGPGFVLLGIVMLEEKRVFSNLFP